LANSKFNIIIRHLVFVVLAIIFSSCASKQKTIANSTTIETSPKLIFLNYSIEKYSNGSKNIQFINKIIADGKLKKNSNKYIDEGVFGDLKCNQLDKNSNILQSVIIKNPLIKFIEYVDESKNFQTKKIKLEKTGFSLKLKLESNTKYITISDISQSEKPIKPLIKIKVNL
jgi:hypothetical protein